MSQGLQSKCDIYGGCYVHRAKRTSTKLSCHSWGIALDIRPATNAMGTPGDMDPAIVKIFRDHGFKWGGDFKDPMHFQYAKGY